MKHPIIKQPSLRLRPFVAALALCGLACLTACGQSEKNLSASDGGRTAPQAVEASDGITAPQPAKNSATTSAPQLIDLRTFATYEGAEPPQQCTLANLSYKTKGEVKPVFEFHRKAFLARGWKETPDTSATEQAASGTFGGAGYRISATVFFGGTPGVVEVTLNNHGNVDLSKLPLPLGATTSYASPITVMSVTEMPVTEASEACRKLLVDAGWEPHGSAGDSHSFKQGTNRITATISSAPAQGGKTMITYLSELMSADLPAPPDADGVQYVDMLRRLTFQTAAEKDAIVAYYKAALAKTGWKPNSEEPYRVDDKDEMIFRNGDGVILLTLQPAAQGQRRVTVSYTTVTEINEAAKHAKEKVEVEKKEG